MNHDDVIRLQPFRRLRAWSSAMALAESIYRLTQDFPRNEEYGLKSQLRRASSSVVANIAEGQGRKGPRAFAAFLDIALGSLREVEALLELALRLRCVEEARIHSAVVAAGCTAADLTRLLLATRKSSARLETRSQ